jgi:DNA-binding transcriptional regulator/RsmH inhibitor MraZ
VPPLSLPVRNTENGGQAQSARGIRSMGTSVISTTGSGPPLRPIISHPSPPQQASSSSSSSSSMMVLRPSPPPSSSREVSPVRSSPPTLHMRLPSAPAPSTNNSSHHRHYQAHFEAPPPHRSTMSSPPSAADLAAMRSLSPRQLDRSQSTIDHNNHHYHRPQPPSSTLLPSTSDGHQFGRKRSTLLPSLHNNKMVSPTHRAATAAPRTPNMSMNTNGNNQYQGYSYGYAIDTGHIAPLTHGDDWGRGRDKVYVIPGGRSRQRRQRQRPIYASPWKEWRQENGDSSHDETATTTGVASTDTDNEHTNDDDDIHAPTGEEVDDGAEGDDDSDAHFTPRVMGPGWERDTTLTNTNTNGIPSTLLVSNPTSPRDHTRTHAAATSSAALSSGRTSPTNASPKNHHHHHGSSLSQLSASPPPPALSTVSSAAHLLSAVPSMARIERSKRIWQWQSNGEYGHMDVAAMMVRSLLPYVSGNDGFRQRCRVSTSPSASIHIDGTASLLPLGAPLLPAKSRLVRFGVTSARVRELLALLHVTDAHQVSARPIEAAPSFAVSLDDLGDNPSRVSEFIGYLLHKKLDEVAERLAWLPAVVSPSTRLYRAQAEELVERLKDLGGMAHVALDSRTPYGPSRTLQSRNSSDTATSTHEVGSIPLFSIHIDEVDGFDTIASVREALPSSLALENFGPLVKPEFDLMDPSPSSPLHHRDIDSRIGDRRAVPSSIPSSISVTSALSTNAPGVLPSPNTHNRALAAAAEAQQALLAQKLQTIALERAITEAEQRSRQDRLQYEERQLRAESDAKRAANADVEARAARKLLRDDARRQRRDKRTRLMVAKAQRAEAAERQQMYIADEETKYEVWNAKNKVDDHQRRMLERDELHELRAELEKRRAEEAERLRLQALGKFPCPPTCHRKIVIDNCLAQCLCDSQ